MKFEKLIIDVRVKDLERAVKFYQDVLELSLIHKDIDWVSFETMGSEIHLYLHGGVEYGFEFRVSNLEESIANLKNKGVRFYTEQWPNLLKISGETMEFSWGRASIFKDSEGNRLTLVEDIKP